jgi:DNA-binding NarL/FixJ family response regulator/anti-sigma regulatory factor (Ser/Thr protein kinase)
VDFKHRGIKRSFSLELKTAVYRILYEALANILQHAQTASVQIWVWIEDDRLKITIEDHGKGFELDAGFANARGLITMQERAALLAGKLTVSSQVGVGTLIMLDVPVADVPNGKVQPTTIKTPVPIPIRNGTTILLAETHATIREKLCQLLNQPNLNLVGEADNCTGMLAKVASRTPEILIVDLTLPGLNGLKPLQLVREQSPQTRILALLPQAEGVYVAQAFQYGASGCLLKSDCGEELLPAVRAIIAGQQYLSPALAKTSQNYTERSPETAQLDGYETLTSREREILLLVAQNHTSSEIADLLTISPRTAEVHRANLMRKLGLRNKADVIRYALKHSLVV